jgi:hypothetical protein
MSKILGLLAVAAMVTAVGCAKPQQMLMVNNPGPRPHNSLSLWLCQTEPEKFEQNKPRILEYAFTVDGQRVDLPSQIVPYMDPTVGAATRLDFAVPANAKAVHVQAKVSSRGIMYQVLQDWTRKPDPNGYDWVIQASSVNPYLGEQLSPDPKTDTRPTSAPASKPVAKPAVAPTTVAPASKPASAPASKAAGKVT